MAFYCHETDQWTKILSTVMLGIRSAWKNDLQATAAELLYGQPLRLPGEFLNRTQHNCDSSPELVKELKETMQKLRPSTGIRHGKRKTFVFKDIRNTEGVFIRRDGPKKPLQQPCEEPFKVLERSERTFTIDMHGRKTTVSVGRLKPAYVLADDPTFSDQKNQANPASQDSPAEVPPSTSAPEPTRQSGQLTTRSGRRVRFTIPFRAG